jgi:hypothetical protein
MINNGLITNRRMKTITIRRTGKPSPFFARLKLANRIPNRNMESGMFSELSEEIRLPDDRRQCPGADKQ